MLCGREADAFRDLRAAGIRSADSRLALTSGADGARTRGLLSARQTLSQLSYGPTSFVSVAPNSYSLAQLMNARWLFLVGGRRSITIVRLATLSTVMK